MSKSLYSPNGEMDLIKTLTNPETSDKARAAVLGKLDQSLFNAPATLAAFRRIQTLAQKRQRVPIWDDLIDDPSFDADVRAELEESDRDPIRSKKRLTTVIERLDKYRKLRELLQITETSIAYFDREDKLDPDELADNISNKLAHVRKKHSTEQKIWNMGVKSNTSKFIKNTLNKGKEKQLRTGFKEYDERNGGLPDSGVFILAGTTSGGKSVVANNLLYNLVTNNRRLTGVKITLEMTAEQELKRIMSMVTGIPFWRIKQNKLSAAEKESIVRKMAKFNKKIKKRKCQMSWVSPEGSMSIDDILNMCKPFGYNVIILDYISLLEGVDDDNQWRMLSAIARKAKVYATETKTLFVILCQLDGKTNQLRYSQGVKEHADVMWAWNYTDEEQRALKVLPIKVVKARDGELFNLDLSEHFEVMRVGDMDSDSGPKFSSKMRKPKSGSKEDSEEGNDGYVMS